MRYNSKIKIYPDGNYSITYCNKHLFSAEKKSKKNSSKRTSSSGLHTKKSNSCINIARSVRRAKDRIFDIIYLNHFDYFVTLTFNPDVVNSYNVIDVMAKFRSWLNNQKQRYDMSYILVPEYHKSGRIHAHVLISGGSLQLSFSHNKTKIGQPIYNVDNWNYGFSTAIPIYNDSSVRIANYVSKYLTKSTKKIFGKYYWSSRYLKRDVPTDYFNTDFFSVELKEYSIPKTGTLLKYDSHFCIENG